MEFPSMYRLTLCFVLLASQSFALPKYERITLPFPDKMDESDKALAQEVLKLEVYQDSKDSNQYYYVPPFHIRQYRKGAGSPMLHVNNVKSYTAAKNELEELSRYAETYSLKEIQRLEEQKNIDNGHVTDALEKIEEATILGNQPLIDMRKKQLERRELILEQSSKKLAQAEAIIDKGQTLLPAGLGRGFYERAMLKIAGTGFSLNLSASESADVLSVEIRKALGELSASYGGNIGVNAYGGFTKAQLDALVAYKSKYMPQIRVSILPVEKLSFFPLTEWQNGTKTASLMVKQINGAGDYLGSAIIIDTTIAGAVGFAEHLGPFVLPIAIKATLKQQIEAVEAILHCDFSNGFSVKGRADVKDGLVIFDNDVTNTIKGKDENIGACNLEHISGNIKSAEYAGLQKIEEQFEAMRIKRVALSRDEKEAYLKGVMADIDNNRRKEEPHYTRTIRRFNGFGWEEVLIEGLTRAADFHWHTNIQDISNISTVKFDKKISLKGYEVIEKDLPVNLCLVFNSARNAYDRCVDVEEDDAKNMSDSMQKVQQSEICKNTTDPFECGRKRDKAGETSRPDYTPTANDNAVPSTLS